MVDTIPTPPPGLFRRQSSNSRLSVKRQSVDLKVDGMKRLSRSITPGSLHKLIEDAKSPHSPASNTDEQKDSPHLDAQFFSPIKKTISNSFLQGALESPHGSIDDEPAVRVSDEWGLDLQPVNVNQSNHNEVNSVTNLQTDNDDTTNDDSDSDSDRPPAISPRSSKRRTYVKTLPTAPKGPLTPWGRPVGSNSLLRKNNERKDAPRLNRTSSLPPIDLLPLSESARACREELRKLEETNEEVNNTQNAASVPHAAETVEQNIDRRTSIRQSVKMSPDSSALLYSRRHSIRVLSSGNVSTMINAASQRLSIRVGTPERPRKSLSPCARDTSPKPQRQPQPQPKNKTGYLIKKGGGTGVVGRKNWLPRFFVLDKGILRYYDSKSEYDAGRVCIKGHLINILQCEVRADNDGDFAFSIIPKSSKSRAYNLRASSEEERTAWIEAIASWQPLLSDSLPNTRENSECEPDTADASEASDL